MILQLDPALPLETPRGLALAHLVIDYGIEADLMWVCFCEIDGQCWTFRNQDVRARPVLDVPEPGCEGDQEHHGWAGFGRVRIMGEMVERIARALYEEEWDTTAWSFVSWDSLGLEGDSDEKNLKAKYLSSARTAIEAMREPDSTMTDPVFDLKIGPIMGHDVSGDDLRIIWATMIDAALKP